MLIMLEIGRCVWQWGYNIYLLELPLNKHVFSSIDVLTVKCLLSDSVLHMAAKHHLLSVSIHFSLSASSTESPPVDPPEDRVAVSVPLCSGLLLTVVDCTKFSFHISSLQVSNYSFSSLCAGVRGGGHRCRRFHWLPSNAGYSQVWREL